MAQSLLNIGDILMLAGNLSGAKKNLQESLTFSRETRDSLPRAALGKPMEARTILKATLAAAP